VRAVAPDFLSVLLAVLLFPVPAHSQTQTSTPTAPVFQLSATKAVSAVIGDFGPAGRPEACVAVLVASWNPDFIPTTGGGSGSGR